jgi:hypothetical protein
MGEIFTIIHKVGRISIPFLPETNITDPLSGFRPQCLIFAYVLNLVELDLTSSDVRYVPIVSVLEICMQ